MPILNIQTQTIGTVGIVPRVIYISTDDSFLQVQTPGYLNHAVSQGFSLGESDMALVETRLTPASREIDNAWFNVTKSNQGWSLTPTTSALQDGYIYVGNSQNQATGVAMSGDATISNTGVVTVSGGGSGGFPTGYVFGFELIYNFITYSVTAGAARDSTDTYDLITTSPQILDPAVVGIGGFDIAPSYPAANWYAIYVIGDSTGSNPTGFIASLSADGGILFPSGYDVYRRVLWGISNPYGDQFLDAGQRGSGLTRTYTPVTGATTSGYYITGTTNSVFIDFSISQDSNNAAAACPQIATTGNFWANFTPSVDYSTAGVITSGYIVTSVNLFGYTLANVSPTINFDFILNAYNDGNQHYASMYVALGDAADAMGLTLFTFTDNLA